MLAQEDGMEGFDPTRGFGLEASKTSGTVPAIPLTRNAVTFVFCQTSRSSRSTSGRARPPVRTDRDVRRRDRASSGGWLALERRGIDREARVVTVERVYTQGVLKPCAKSSRQRRRVPLRQRVLDAIDALPPRLDSPLLFPAAKGGHIELGKWRERVWKPALRAAGIEHRRIYDCRHTYATWSLAAGVSLFALSRRMGTSLAMIDQTYGHLAPGRRGSRARAPRCV
jgi:hypothetical protein